MKAILIFFVCLLIYIVSAALPYGQCPPANRVYNDKPRCFSNADCQKWGKICCPNQHNTKSCVDRAPWRNANGIGYDHKYSGGGGGGVYCEGVKCMPYEVCKRDPITKRLRCQRP